MLNKSRFNWLAAGGNVASQPTLGSWHSQAGRTMHILAPTSLAPTDYRALRFALKLAAAHSHTLTVLHIRPAAAEPGACYGLDAIRLLHQAADRIAGRIPLRDTPLAVDLDCHRVRAFLETAFPRRLLRGIELRVECRRGDAAKGIAQFADERAVDLVVMTGGLCRWWWPIMPVDVRRVLRLTSRQVVLVHATPARPCGDA